MKVIIASHNAGKIKEFKEMFAPLAMEVQSLLDFPELAEVEETGQTFEANARLKAEQIAQELNCIALADDSGLVVPALNGEPGIYSARYSGEPKDDHRNNQKLLDRLQEVNASDRSAYFVSCIVVAHPKMESLVVEGRAHGEILEELRGVEGFGYDPLFYVASQNSTFAEIPLSVKNKISHRANATAQLLDLLPSWLEELKQL